MTLYADPPSTTFKVRLALAFIGLGQTSHSESDLVLEGVPVTKITITATQNANWVWAERLQQLSQLPFDIVISQKGPDYVLPNGVSITAVGAATQFIPIGMLVVYDGSDCYGKGYHVIDRFGRGISLALDTMLAHELSHVFHTVMGSHPEDPVAGEALAIHEENLYRQAEGLPLRDPNNHNGGCGPGPQTPWWLAPLVPIIKLFGASSSPGPADPQSGEAANDALMALRAELPINPALFSAIDPSSHARALMHQDAILRALSEYYGLVKAILEYPDDTERLAKLIHELRPRIAEFEKETSLIPALTGSFEDPDTIASAAHWLVYLPSAIILKLSRDLARNDAVLTDIAECLRSDIISWRAELPTKFDDRRPGLGVFGNAEDGKVLETGFVVR